MIFHPIKITTTPTPWKLAKQSARNSILSGFIRQLSGALSFLISTEEKHHKTKLSCGLRLTRAITKIPKTSITNPIKTSTRSPNGLSWNFGVVNEVDAMYWAINQVLVLWLSRSVPWKVEASARARWRE